MPQSAHSSACFRFSPNHTMMPSYLQPISSVSLAKALPLSNLLCRGPHRSPAHAALPTSRHFAKCKKDYFTLLLCLPLRSYHPFHVNHPACPTPHHSGSLEPQNLFVTTHDAMTSLRRSTPMPRPPDPSQPFLDQTFIVSRQTLYNPTITRFSESQSNLRSNMFVQLFKTSEEEHLLSSPANEDRTQKVVGSA